MAFIVYEGLDACGKSTQIESLHRELFGRGQKNLVLRDPGTTPLGEKIRKLILDTEGEAPVPKAETLLYQAARVQMVEKLIRPALNRGEWVICDRFYSSTVAFQAFARGLTLSDIENLNHFVAQNAEPDLFILLDITVEESQRRKELRAQQSGVGQDRIEKENQDFQSKVWAGYQYQCHQHPERWLKVDGTLPPDEILKAVILELEKKKWLV